jgi:hypothetical protein|tara:strand:+ start:1370 stop:1696 length:327 start_codon:yes stop_codon:yes gene_type:complete
MIDCLEETKMIKLKDILKESSPGYENRQFGDPLPTIKDIAREHQKKNKIKEENLNEGPDADLFKALDYIDKDIIRVIKKYENKADVDKIAHSWMLGLHAKLKKHGIKI